MIKVTVERYGEEWTGEWFETVDQSFEVTLINVVRLDGRWVAIVLNEDCGEIYNVPASHLKEWAGDE